MRDKILILDFGAQYSQLIARRVRESKAAQLGGRVENARVREFGYAEIRARGHSKLLEGIQDRVNGERHGLLDVWMSHGDKVTALPPGFKIIASSDASPIAGMADETRRFYGVQFHPEVTHTRSGSAILGRFVREICGCRADWNMPGYVKVDSVDASERFLRALAGVSDPEEKRKIIGREFVEVFQQEAKKVPKVKWLAQGTIYPDVIESAGARTKKAHTIKSHHNVGGLPDTLHLKLLEPLRELFKDEVRELGLALGLPRELVFRHPFPGPGLGVRILGEVKREYADLLRRADAIFIEELRAASPSPQEGEGRGEGGNVPDNWYDAVAQAFAVFLPVKSVGVMGDGRTYEHVVALRAVQTTDFMTAHWAPLPHELLAKVSNRIINEVRGINRVVYDVSGKPPATIEWE